MRNIRILFLGGLLLAGGCGGSTIEFKEALVLLREPYPEGEKTPVYFGFVNQSHPRYMDKGNVRVEIPGAKPLSDSVASACLSRLTDLGYPEAWTSMGDLQKALIARKAQYVLITEVDGKVHILVRGALGTTSESHRDLQRFVDSKKALIDAAGYTTGFRVIPNPQGAGLFENQRKRLGKGSRKKE
ncbi:MAG: hypothetical protein ACYTHM_14125 [Planctomycetota bacterium]|jgi:hypothetical protein